MPDDFDVRLDADQRARLTHLLRSLGAQSSKFLAQAINKSIINAQTEAIKKIDSDLALKPTRSAKDGRVYSPKKRIKSDFYKLRAKAKTNSEASLKAVGKPLTLSNFSPMDTPTGVHVKVLKRGGGGIVKRAFIAPVKGVKHVLQRKYAQKSAGHPMRPKRAIRYAGLQRKYRYKIQMKYGPRIEDSYAKFFDEVSAHSADNMVTNLEKIIEKYLSTQR